MYRIPPNFRGAQFSRIAIPKHFAETIFADQEFRVYGIPLLLALHFEKVYGILKFRELNFRRLLGSAKTAKITRLENLGVAIRHYRSLSERMHLNPTVWLRETTWIQN